MPDQIDVWRAVSGRYAYAGTLALTAFTRLRDSLAQADGQVEFELEFGNDDLGQAFVELYVHGALPLVCQRSLEVYRQPVAVRQRLGLIRREDEEAGLPPGYEPCLVPGDGMVAPADLVEDELILALPLVPARPGSEPAAGSDAEEQPESRRENPFAALKSLKVQ
ncbi:MAG: YceD family protein [Xanthomonadales bacterium]|nr:YceD family protein [Xanthomonadales bacterium]